jgi:rhodanese-related sulfurtransferase
MTTVLNNTPSSHQGALQDFVRLGRLSFLCLVGILVSWCQLQAQEVQLLSLSQNGILTWTNSSLNVTCRVEWASSATGPWHSSWESLTNIVVTNNVIEKAVPMFYRVVSTTPATLLNITPEESLALITNNVGNTNFVILDVRTPTEFATGHIKSAININYYSTTFQDELAVLDRNKTYLVYCGSGMRSGNTLPIMCRLSFRTAYNMIIGYWAFSALPDAQPYLQY